MGHLLNCVSATAAIPATECPRRLAQRPQRGCTLRLARLGQQVVVTPFDATPRARNQVVIRHPRLVVLAQSIRSPRSCPAFLEARGDLIGIRSSFERLPARLPRRRRCPGPARAITTIAPLDIRTSISHRGSRVALRLKPAGSPPIVSPACCARPSAHVDHALHRVRCDRRSWLARFHLSSAHVREIRLRTNAATHA